VVKQEHHSVSSEGVDDDAAKENAVRPHLQVPEADREAPPDVRREGVQLVCASQGRVADGVAVLSNQQGEAEVATCISGGMQFATCTRRRRSEE